MLFLVVLVTALQASPSPERVQFESRCITVAAVQSSLRDLIADWARLGQVKVTGLELIPDRVVTLNAECADERKTLEALLDGLDRFLVPRGIDVRGASQFVALVILSRDPSQPRHAVVPNVIPELAYPDPAPGRNWSAVEPDVDAPPPVVIDRAERSVTPLAPAVPETQFEYARTIPPGLSELLLPRDSVRANDHLLELIESVRIGVIPEALFEYATPARKGGTPDKKEP